MGNVFVKVEYQCLLAALVGRFEFERGGRGEIVWGSFFVYSMNMNCYQRMKEGWRVRMWESGAVTGCFLRSHISPSKVVTDHPTITTLW